MLRITCLRMYQFPYLLLTTLGLFELSLCQLRSFTKFLVVLMLFNHNILKHNTAQKTWYGHGCFHNVYNTRAAIGQGFKPDGLRDGLFSIFKRITGGILEWAPITDNFCADSLAMRTMIACAIACTSLGAVTA